MKLVLSVLTSAPRVIAKVLIVQGISQFEDLNIYRGQLTEIRREIKYELPRNIKKIFKYKNIPLC